MNSPFDDAKYQALLNGLTISEVRFSGLEIISNRLDAEHYEHQYLLAEQKLLTANGKPLEILTKDIKSFGAYSLCNQIEYQESGIPFLRCQNIKDGLVDFADVLFINQDANKILWKSEVKPGMVLLTMSGTVGNAAAAMEHWEYPINSNQDVAKITTNERIDSFYLTVFLNSHFGKLQMSRLPIGSVQQHIFLWQLAKLIIPVPSLDFQSFIKTCYLQAISLREKAINFYREAEELLLAELGLTNWQPKHRLSFVKNYSDAQHAERLDAEYFQPKYEEIEKAIMSYAGGYSYIKDEFKQNKSTFEADNKRIYQYVEIGSINVSSGEITAEDVEGSQLPDNAKRVLEKDDIVISKVRTYRGAIAIVDKEGYVGSGAFTILRENGRVNKETLLTFLHSKPLLTWSIKPNTGTSYPVIVDDDILNLPIPLFDKDIQTRIQQKITESINLRKHSKHLLECAKRAVEIAIEQDEQAAFALLERSAALPR